MIHQLTLLPLHQKRPGRWAWLQKWHQTACHSWPWTRTEMLDFSIWGLEQAIHLFAWESWLQNWQFSSQLHCCPTTRSRARLNRSANLKPTSWTYSIHPLTVQRDFVHECYKQNLWKGQPYSPKLTGTYTTPTEKKKNLKKIKLDQLYSGLVRCWHLCNMHYRQKCSPIQSQMITTAWTEKESHHSSWKKSSRNPI